MADSFQTGGEHTPPKNREVDGTVMSVDPGYPSLYDPDPTKVTLLNRSPYGIKDDKK